MSVIAAALKHMLAAGMPHDAIVAAVEAMEEAQPVAVVDEAAERRRKKDRDRKREFRRRPQTSADSTDIGDTTLPPPSPPQTPQLPPPTRRDINTPAREDGPEFDLFWSAYPRKVGKDDARKKFAVARKTGVTVAELLQAIARDRERQWRDRPAEMIPHPATWLHQGRWKDEPDQNQPQAQSQAHERRNPPADRFERRQANLERALAGFDIAVGLRAEQSEGGF